MTVSTYSTGWCNACDTNACEHVQHLNMRNKTAFDMLLQSMQEMKPARTLPGLTGNKISDRYLDKWLKDRGMEFKKEEQTEIPEWMKQQLEREFNL